ncbi:EexN family lipoprotein [Vibrio parahaemolyticus]|nr:EexN family lipoprotein [Vibrio parahaemolyticus]HBC3550351.1 EexN family lipoprotein [Vibrio parahaemolyticus]
MIISCARKAAILAGVSISMAGCFENEKVIEPTQSVEWFKANDSERKLALQRCANNPGELSEAPNCKNAQEAQKQLSSGSLKKVSNW